MEVFGKMFEQKTGVAWGCITSCTPQANKYLWCGHTYMYRICVASNYTFVNYKNRAFQWYVVC